MIARFMKAVTLKVAAFFFTEKFIVFAVSNVYNDIIIVGNKY